MGDIYAAIDKENLQDNGQRANANIEEVEEESPSRDFSSQNKFSKGSLSSPCIAGAATALLSPNITLDLPACAWGNPKSPFFPPLYGKWAAEASEKCQAGVSLSLDDSGSHTTAHRHKRKGNKNGQCLTPVPEVSPLREGGTEKEDGEKEGGDRMYSQYHHFFAQECKNIVQNIRRQSCQTFPGEGTRTRGGVGPLDITSIEEETLAYWNSVNYSMELSCLQTSLLPSHPENVKEEKMMAEVEDGEHSELPGGSSISVGSSTKDSHVSLPMDKTQLIDTGSSNNSKSVLEGTYNLPDVDGSVEGQGLLGTEEIKVMVKEFCEMDMNPKEKPPIQTNCNDTYDLTNNAGQAGLNVTVELTEQSLVRPETEAGLKGEETARNDTYELQPVLRDEHVGASQEDGEKDMGKLDMDSPGNGGLSESVCSHSMNAGASMLSLDDTLDTRPNLITSTPMTVPKVQNFSKQPDATCVHLQKKLLEAPDLTVCCEVDEVNVTGDVVRSATPHVDHPPPVIPEGPTGSPPKPAPALEQCTGSRPSVVTHRKSLLPPSANAANRKSQLPPPRPSSSNLAAPVSIGKKAKGAPKSPARNMTATRSLSSAVSAPGKKQSTVAETKLPSSGLQKPRASGLAPPSSLRSRLGLRPLTWAASKGETQAAATNRPLGSKGSSVQPPTQAQKQPRGSTDDTLPDSKRTRVDAPATTSEAVRGLPVPVGGAHGLMRPTTRLSRLQQKEKNSDAQSSTSEAPRGLPVPAGGVHDLTRPTTRLNGLQQKEKNSDAPATSSEAPRGLPVPAGGANGPRRPSSRLKGLQPNVKNSASVFAVSVPASQNTQSPASATEALSSAVTGTCESENPLRKADENCENCVQYQQEIERLREELQKLKEGRTE
ncbi:hypothetical protein MATL_G00046880 [Megalops atlanticus]|uniref:Uncharacterized protein n=1 Tax=Megalops atlanticus TaxID=7932 RepID=A0A9D3TBH3_MEGAT|nr:hypothetical protein MATL_G00046880 [Megalops atlanticus]